MAARRECRKLHDLFTRWADPARAESAHGAPAGEWGCIMAGLAMVMFVTLFAFGSSYFGWDDPAGKVSLALFASFVFGIICGYRVK